jgi:nucleoside-diphosphate-sugar epimerase
MHKIRDIIVFGASGFIGSFLIDQLLYTFPSATIHVLFRQLSNKYVDKSNVKVHNGDLFDKATIKKIIIKNSVVINLVYMPKLSQEDNLKIVNNICQECEKKDIYKLIHLSTAVVTGNSFNKVATEDMLGNPVSDYEKSKLLIENVISSYFSKHPDKYLILRPTCVFGSGGQNLIKLYHELMFGNIVINYAKACLYGRRKMNLVPVLDVISAIIFLINKGELPHKNRTFIVSNDENINNNYNYVLGRFNFFLKRKSFVPILILTPKILSWIFKIVGKNPSAPFQTYSEAKIKNIGWSSSTTFEAELDNFIKKLIH